MESRKAAASYCCCCARRECSEPQTKELLKIVLFRISSAQTLAVTLHGYVQRVYNVFGCVCVLLGCAKGRYGPNCALQCDCENGATCDAVSGRCICRLGWIGPRCTVSHGQTSHRHAQTTHTHTHTRTHIHQGRTQDFSSGGAGAYGERGSASL